MSEREQLSLFVVQAEVPKGKTRLESLPIEGRDGVGMFRTDEQAPKQLNIIEGDNNDVHKG